jgi:hypothetical protein
MKLSLLIISFFLTQSSFAQTVDPEKLRILELFQMVENAVNEGSLGADCKFERDEPHPIPRPSSRKRQTDSVWYDYLFEDQDHNFYKSGFVLENHGPGESFREWRFVSQDHSKRETYLWVTDDPGMGRNSSLMDSVIVLLPRKVRPSIVAIGDEVQVTLTTGEKVVYDKKTKAIKSGVIKESPLDLNRDNAKRKFPDITYTGTGISIRVDKRGSNPRASAGSATVTQKWSVMHSCGKRLMGPRRESF